MTTLTHPAGLGSFLGVDPHHYPHTFPAPCLVMVDDIVVKIIRDIDDKAEAVNKAEREDAVLSFLPIETLQIIQVLGQIHLTNSLDSCYRFLC
jgi:hypothetical protein